ncbi:MAG: hypothetical protein GY832_36910 [Chloroflexi bacterium]|nr:hypothetical protein [Chloroflexota bacterium]
MGRRIIIVTQAIATARYVVDSNGEKTDVLVPLAAWKTLLASWKHIIELIEDQKDSATLQEWLEKRAAGEVDMISLDALEQELIAYGLSFQS